MYPVGKPYVNETNVSLKANVPNEQRKDMELQLYNYLDDSLKITTKSVIGLKQKVNPPVFDTANIERSKGFMKNYLNSLGYYQATIQVKPVEYDTVVNKIYTKTRLFGIFGRGKKKVPGIATKISFAIDAGKQLKFDSIWYDLKVPELEKLANETKEKALMKKGEGYSKQIVGQELDRLVSLYRNAGYFKMTRSSLSAEFDSINTALISLDNDPFLQIQQSLKRRLNPTVNFRIMQRPGADTTTFLKYHIGNLTIYPEARIDEDLATLMARNDLKLDSGRRGVEVRYREGKFNSKTVRRFNTLVPGRLYNEDDYFKTVNAYSQAGSWQQVDVKANTYIDSTDSTPKVDINLFLTPAKKFSTKVDLEGSQNIGRNSVDVLTGSFFGVSVVGNLLNRNFNKSAIQWNSNLRTGVEISTNRRNSISNSIFQTVLLSGGTTFSIPRLWPPLKNLIKRPEASRTFLSIGGGYNDRRDFYKLTNLNIALGYEWKKKGNIWTIKTPNVEFVDLVQSDSLIKLIEDNPNLRYSFKKGLVVGLGVNYQREITYQKKPNHNSFVRISAEESGLLTGSFFKEDQILRFWKVDGELRHYINHARHKWAFRITGGYGRGYMSGTASLPFFRQFIAGGPNSMRAWRLRQLGLGNSLSQDTFTLKGTGARSNFRDRLGDIYMEANAEYRFHMFKIIGFPIEGAFFADMGNIWNRYSTTNNPGDGVLKFKNIYRDLAVDAGYGIRWDFSYLRVRFDIAYKFKDPVRAGNGWSKRLEYKTVNRSGNYENNNMAIQFGIDYPF